MDIKTFTYYGKGRYLDTTLDSKMSWGYQINTKMNIKTYIPRQQEVKKNQGHKLTIQIVLDMFKLQF